MIDDDAGPGPSRARRPFAVALAVLTVLSVLAVPVGTGVAQDTRAQDAAALVTGSTSAADAATDGNDTRRVGLSVSIAQENDDDDPGDVRDETSQPLPRDGRTVDLVFVNTSNELTGEPINDSVTLSVPDVAGDLPAGEGGDAATRDNFAGAFLGVTGGDLLREDPVNNTITIATGPDGNATVRLRTDESTATLAPVLPNDRHDVPDNIEDCRDPDDGVVEFSGVVLQSNTDRTAVDSTCKLFGGVVRAAQVSGIVTDQDNDALAGATVWIDRFTLDGKDTGVTVDRLGADRYRVTLYNDTTLLPRTVVGRATVSADALRDFRFSSAFDEQTIVRRGLAPLEDRGLTLLTTTSTRAGARGEYTLPRVPATATPNDYAVTARFRGETGDGDARDLRAGRTDDANVVIRALNVTGAAVTVDDQSGDGTTATVAAYDLGDTGTAVSVWAAHDGDAPDRFLGAVRPTATAGGPLAVPLDDPLAANATVVATVHDGAPDTVETIVARDTARYTRADGTLADRYDADGDGAVDERELLRVVEAFNTGEITDETVVLRVIAAYNADAGWSDVA